MTAPVEGVLSEFMWQDATRPVIPRIVGEIGADRVLGRDKEPDVNGRNHVFIFLTQGGCGFSCVL